MKILYRTKSKIFLTALCYTISFILAQFAFTQDAAQQAMPKTGQRGFMQIQLDPRVQKRTYLFKDTNEDMQYCLFVSSKVSKDRKNPVIVTLHGLGVGPEIMFNRNALDLAEEGGYILMGPMGYNVRGWYGIPMSQWGGVPGRQA
jgi:predicted peptidase